MVIWGAYHPLKVPGQVDQLLVLARVGGVAPSILIGE